MAPCGHEQPDDKRIFCIECGKLVSRANLLTVGINSFTGLQSLSPQIEHALATGEPPV